MLSRETTLEPHMECKKIISFHYENLPMQYTDYFSAVKIENFIRKKLVFFLIFAQNIDRGYEAVLTSTHNLCFGAKIRTRGPMVL